MVPSPAPGGHHSGKLLAARPLLEGIELGQCCLGVCGGVDRPERSGKQLAILPAGVVLAVANQVQDACLQRSGREQGAQGLGHALETICQGNQDVVDPPGLHVVEHLHPELGFLGAFNPQAQDVAAAVGQHAQGQLNGHVANDGVFLDLHVQRIEEHHRVHRLQRASLLGRHLGRHRLGHAADEFVGNVGAVGLQQETLDLAHGHAARVHRDDVMVKAGEAPLVLGDEDQLETAVPFARNFDTHLPFAREHGLAAGTVALVGCRLGLGRASGVAQVFAQFSAHGALDQDLLEGHVGRVDGLPAHQPGDELVKQFLGHLRQRRSIGRDGRVHQLRLAWHKWSCRSCLCLKHKTQEKLV